MSCDQISPHLLFGNNHTSSTSQDTEKLGPGNEAKTLDAKYNLIFR